MYQEKDFIPDLGEVDSNHCGLPWVAHPKGELCGVLQIKGFSPSVFIDALSGKVLPRAEMENRLNNYNFDYESKSRNCQEWRTKNQPDGPYHSNPVCPKCQNRMRTFLKPCFFFLSQRIFCKCIVCSYICSLDFTSGFWLGMTLKSAPGTKQETEIKKIP